MMDNKTLRVIIGFIIIIQRAAGDDLGLLSSTLRAFRTLCCDDELLTLSCPIGTSISVELVQYGTKEGNDTVQCAYSEADSHYYIPESTAIALSTVDFSVGITTNGTTVTPMLSTTTAGEMVTNDTSTSVERPRDKCTPLYVLQYSILQTVVEACQKKRRCRIQASPKNFATAPCPGIHRMVEVNHKCRPFEFRSLISCEKDIVRLTCGQYTRIAIYSATYGRTAYESSHCSQTATSKEQTCLSDHTSHTLTEICQGRRKCTVAVESSTFGNPCPENIRVYLKVIYACVSRNVFRERYITPLEDDEQDERPYESNELYDEELTPAPNQIEGSFGGKGVGLSKYPGSAAETAVKAENIVTFNGNAGDNSGTHDYPATFDEGHLLIVGVAVLFFSCLCLSIGALLAYKMKLFPSGRNRCIKSSESTESHSTPSSYRAPSEDFDLVECMPTTEAMTGKGTEQPPTQTFVQPVATSAPVSAVPTSTLLPAFKFTEPRGNLAQISTTMFILPNYLMSGPVPGTLSNRRRKDPIPTLPPSDNLTITLATSSDIPGGSSMMETASPSYYSQHLQPHQQQQHQQHHIPYGVNASCGQCTVLGWQAASSAPPVYGGKLLALENPAITDAATNSTSHPYHRNQSLKPSVAETEKLAEVDGPTEVKRGMAGATQLTQQSHPFLWLGLKIGLM